MNSSFFDENALNEIEFSLNNNECSQLIIIQTLTKLIFHALRQISQLPSIFADIKSQIHLLNKENNILESKLQNFDSELSKKISYLNDSFINVQKQIFDMRSNDSKTVNQISHNQLPNSPNQQENRNIFTEVNAQKTTSPNSTKPKPFETDIFKACQNGILGSVKYLIENQNVNKIKKNGNGDTPIHIAAENGHLPIVQYLIDSQNVDKDIKGYSDRTPLHYACHYGHLPIVEYLISKGANIEAVSRDQWTPLHYASKNGRVDVVKYLISKGANKAAKTKMGKTPYDYGNESIRKILK